MWESLKEHGEFFAFVAIGLIMWIFKTAWGKLTKLEARVASLELTHVEELSKVKEQLGQAEIHIIEEVGMLRSELNKEYVRKGECQRFQGIDCEEK